MSRGPFPCRQRNPGPQLPATGTHREDSVLQPEGDGRQARQGHHLEPAAALHHADDGAERRAALDPVQRPAGQQPPAGHVRHEGADEDAQHHQPHAQHEAIEVAGGHVEQDVAPAAGERHDDEAHGEEQHAGKAVQALRPQEQVAQVLAHQGQRGEAQGRQDAHAKAALAPAGAQQAAGAAPAAGLGQPGPAAARLGQRAQQQLCRRQPALLRVGPQQQPAGLRRDEAAGVAAASRRRAGRPGQPAAQLLPGTLPHGPGQQLQRRGPRTPHPPEPPGPVAPRLPSQPAGRGGRSLIASPWPAPGGGARPSAGRGRGSGGGRAGRRGLCGRRASPSAAALGGGAALPGPAVAAAALAERGSRRAAAAVAASAAAELHLPARGGSRSAPGSAWRSGRADVAARAPLAADGGGGCAPAASAPCSGAGLGAAPRPAPGPPRSWAGGVRLSGGWGGASVRRRCVGRRRVARPRRFAALLSERLIWGSSLTEGE